MSKSLLVGLSVLFMSLGCGGAARAQYQDPLDDVYARLNAQAQKSNVSPSPTTVPAAYAPQGAVQQGGVQQYNVQPGRPVVDRHSYDQFMNRTFANLNVEASNSASQAAARRTDALTTGKYEEKQINDQADFEREQLRNSTLVANRSRNGRTYLTTAPTDAAAAASSPAAAAEYAAIEGRQKAAIEMSQTNTQRRLEDNQRYAQERSQALVDAAENLREQVLDAQNSKNTFGLQGVGTNLYVRQYGRPNAVLPPVHAAAARIVPAGSGN